jgi:hypothetical protein
LKRELVPGRRVEKREVAAVVGHDQRIELQDLQARTVASNGLVGQRELRCAREGELERSDTGNYGPPFGRILRGLLLAQGEDLKAPLGKR